MTESFFVRELPGETPLGRETAARLCKAAASLRQLKPWSWMAEDQLVLVRDAAGQTHSVSVMGAVGDFEAVAVYLGAEGQHFFERAHESPISTYSSANSAASGWNSAPDPSWGRPTATCCVNWRQR